MSSPAVLAFVARAVREEGSKLKPYDDKTGKPVVAPVGNLTWGIGFNLMECGSAGLFAVMLAYLLEQTIEPVLSAFAWYKSAGPARQSVFLDIAYNEGVHGFLGGFPHLIAAAAKGDWTECAKQCSVADVSIDTSRYKPLRRIIQTGATTP